MIFDRSWYNRAGVEYVMGFCTKEQHSRFLQDCPLFEEYIVEAGIMLFKYWLEVSNEEQERRFAARIDDPLRQWKLSPVDLPSRTRWYDYSRARDLMLEATDTKLAPWHIVRSDDKKRARLNCISHLLSLIPYERIPRKKVKLPKRSNKGAYDDQARARRQKIHTRKVLRSTEDWCTGRLRSVRTRATIATAFCFAGFCIVLTWWLSLRPSNDGDWQADADRTAWVEINGDRVTIHNLRNCDYRTKTDYTNCWSDRTVYLSQLRYVDFFFTNWGPKWIGHPIVSFQFGDNDHIAFSIEARYKVGQIVLGDSWILSAVRTYLVVADERDVIRLRTNYRKHEQVFMYRTTISPKEARAVLLIYLDYLNKLRAHPEWYNALTRNCTTTLDRQIAAELENPQPWNYQLMLNGTLDKLLYHRGRPNGRLV